MLDYTPFSVIPGGWNPATEGWKRCDCPTPEDGDNCATLKLCPRDGSIFDDESNNWKKLTIDDADGRTNPNSERLDPLAQTLFLTDGSPTTVPDYNVRWLWWHDLDPAIMGNPPGPGEQHADIAVGRLWWFVPYSGAFSGRISSKLGFSAVKDSVYTALRLTERSGQVSIPSSGVRQKSGMTNFYCPNCPQSSPLVKFLQAVDPADAFFQVVAVPAKGLATDITSQFSASAVRALARADSTLVTSSEPSYRLLAADVSHVMLGSDNSVQAVFHVTPAGKIFTASGSGSLSATRAPRFAVATSITPRGSGVSLALSGRNRALFAAGTSDGAVVGGLWRNDLVGRGWESVPILSGPSPGRVRALTAMSSDGSLYAIDEFGDRIRLLSVDAAHGTIREIRSWKNLHHATLSLSAGYGDGLLLGISQGKQHVFALLTISGEKLVRVRLQRGDGAVALGPRATRDGVGWAEVNVDPHCGRHPDDEQSDREHDGENRGDEGQSAPIPGTCGDLLARMVPYAAFRGERRPDDPHGEREMDSHARERGDRPDDGRSDGEELDF